MSCGRSPPTWSPITSGARFAAQMARRARKRWLGLTTVTQEVEDFLASPEGHTVLANSSVQMLMRQESSAAGLVAELSSGEREFVTSSRRGQGLLLAHGNRVALGIEASGLEASLATTDPAELAAGGRGMEVA